MSSRREFLKAAAMTAGGVMSSGASASVAGEEGEQRPNFLIFMPDQQQGHTVLPESPCVKPNLLRFQREGVLFRNAFCPTAHCCPSRASFMTGLYPSEHGVFNNVDTDSAIHPNPYPGTRYFSQDLRRSGYEVAYAGKWHVARNVTPQDVGWTNLTPERSIWETYVPHREASNWGKAHGEYLHEGARTEAQVQRPGWGDISMYATLPAGYENLYDYKLVRTGIDGMQRLAKGNKPWCLMVSNDGGHDLYHAPKEFVDLYDPEKIEIPANFHDVLADKPRIYQRMRYQYWSQLTEREIRRTIAHYWAKLSMQDFFFGLLLDELQRTGQAENTVVLYISDHGDYCAAHGLWAKGIPAFREAYNIPCVVRWPKGIAQPGRQVDALVSTTDIAPTILEAAGVTKPEMKLSGSSLMPWLRAKQPVGWRDAACFQVNGFELYYTQRTVVTQDFKYVYNGFDFDELYDLKNDPGETVNLAFPNAQRAGAVVEHGEGWPNSQTPPWPPLSPDLNQVRKDMLTRMWKFAKEHNDQIFNNYITVAMAPFGPGIALS